MKYQKQMHERGQLKARNEKVFNRVMLGETLAAVSKDYDVTLERIRQIVYVYARNDGSYRSVLTGERSLVAMRKRYADLNNGK